MYQKNNPSTIQTMFGSIADSYDRTNAVLSFGLHKKWNSKLVCTLLADRQAQSLLDLCGGTGEITFSFLRHSKQVPSKIYLLDFCKEMLKCAEEKALLQPADVQQSLEYIHADAQEIPLPDQSVDCTTIAYGIRNVQDPKKCLAEVYRVLRSGGTLGILELTRPSNPILRFGHSLYLRGFLPIAGWCLTSNREAYKYLCNSIQVFINPSDLEGMLTEVGFNQVTRIPLSGGIATILFAKK